MSDPNAPRPHPRELDPLLRDVMVLVAAAAVLVVLGIVWHRELVWLVGAIVGFGGLLAGVVLSLSQRRAVVAIKNESSARETEAPTPAENTDIVPAPVPVPSRSRASQPSAEPVHKRPVTADNRGLVRRPVARVHEDETRQGANLPRQPRQQQSAVRTQTSGPVALPGRAARPTAVRHAPPRQAPDYDVDPTESLGSAVARALGRRGDESASRRAQRVRRAQQHSDVQPDVKDQR